MTTVALLGNDVAMREEVTEFLSGEGYRVLNVDSVAAFESLIDAFDIAIIDVCLSDGDGLQVAARLRALRPQCGIIMLTGQGGLRLKLASLRESSDFFLLKPVSMEELQAHLIALGRRIGSRWQLRLVERGLVAPSGHVELLNEAEMILMTLLARYVGEVVTRKEIARAFEIDWLQFDGRWLDQTVSRLRRRWLGRSGRELPIRTEHGKGYIFTANIELI